MVPASSPPITFSETSIPSSEKVFWSSIAPATRMPTRGNAFVPGETPGCNVKRAAAFLRRVGNLVIASLETSLPIWASVVCNSACAVDSTFTTSVVCPRSKVKSAV